MEITLWIKGQELRVLGKQPNLYHGSVGVLYIKFFDENFDTTLIKTVRFKTEESEWYTADVIDGRVRVPHEVIVVGGFDVAVGGYETRNGELLRFLPTNSVHIDVFENGFGGPDAPLSEKGNPESVIAKFEADIEKKADLEYVKNLIPNTSISGQVITLTDHIEGSGVINYLVRGNSIQNTRSGKNLFNIESFVKTINETVSKGYEIVPEIYDGKECYKIYGISMRNSMFPLKLKENTRYSISMDYNQFSLIDGNGNKNFGPLIQVFYTDGSSQDLIGKGSNFNKWLHLSFLTAENKTVSHISGIYGTGAAYTYVTNWQIEEGTVETEYEAYGKMPSEEFPSEVKSVGDYTKDGKYIAAINVKSKTGELYNSYEILLNEPLRKVNGVCDYIDFKNQRIVRNIDVLDNSGTLSIEESLGVLSEPISEELELPPIVLPDCESVSVSVDTVVDADMELRYYQDINKKIAQMEKAIENK